jgi:hypothetical protein
MELSLNMGSRCRPDTIPVAATRSLGALVDELVIYLRDQHKLQETMPPHRRRPKEDAFEDYVRHFLATLKQLIPALDQLKYDSKADIAGLTSAAHALVEADGAVRMQEVAYLASLQDALLSL